MTVITVIFLSYLLGSIPFGLLLTRLFGLGDIRHIGSGNIGATNVMRTGRKWLGALVLLLDAGKGFAAVHLTAVWLIVSHIGHPQIGMFVAGLAVVIGHVFPIWLKFKGGKGVATAIGVFYAFNPVFGLAICIFWLAIFTITRTSSISSLMAVGYSPIISYLMDGDTGTALLYLNIAALVVFTHRSNIRRLLHGKEHTFEKRS